jgi:hypothetical protein
MAELAPLQGWMQAAILAGGATADEAGARVRPSARLAPEQRVAIYAQGYRARLLETLRAEYPVLRRFAGDTAFDLFARGYIARARSTAPSLWDFGAGFADHLALGAAAEAPDSPRAIPSQLARLARARAEVERGRGVERDGPAVISAADALGGGAGLRVPDTVRLLRLNFDFAALVRAVDAGEAGEMPEPGPWHVAVARAHYRVGLHGLDAGRFAFLRRLAAGANVTAAAAGAADEAARPLGALLGELMLWLPLAAQQGLVAAAASD